MSTEHKPVSTYPSLFSEEFTELSPGEELALRADAIAQGSPLGMLDEDEGEEHNEE